MSRVDQYRQAFAVTRENDPDLVRWMVLGALAGLLVGAGLGYVAFDIPGAVLLGLLFAGMAAMAVFGRRATNAQLDAIEGKPGAAAAVIQTMRGHWRVQLAVKVTAKQEFVHRAVGRPGVVLIGEGRSSAKVKQLLVQEESRMKRVLGDTPLHAVRVGDGADEVGLKQLSFHLAKLPKSLKKDEVDALATRLDALGGDKLPMPKGPMPRGRQR